MALKAWVVVAAGLRSRGRLLQSSGRRVHESASLFVRGAGAEKKAKDPQHISAAARLWSQRQIRDKIYRRVKKILNWILRLAAAKRKSDVNSCFCSSYRTKWSRRKKNLTNIKSDPTSSRPDGDIKLYSQQNIHKITEGGKWRSRTDGEVKLSSKNYLIIWLLFSS